MSLLEFRNWVSYYRVRPSTRLTPASLKADNFKNHRRLGLQHCQSEIGVGSLSLETKTRFWSDWVFKRQDSNFEENVCIYLYTVGHRSQSSDGQWNLSSDANRISTRRRSLDGVDSSGDKTPITTIPTVGVDSSSDKMTIATFPAFQGDLLKC